jgi:hypothetical protein
VLAANGSDPPRLRSDLMVGVIAAILVMLGAWIAALYRLLRPGSLE